MRERPTLRCLHDGPDGAMSLGPGKSSPPHLDAALRTGSAAAPRKALARIHRYRLMRPAAASLRSRLSQAARRRSFAMLSVTSCL